MIRFGPARCSREVTKRQTPHSSIPSRLNNRIYKQQQPHLRTMMNSPSRLYKPYSNQQLNFLPQYQFSYPLAYDSFTQGQRIKRTQLQHLLSAYATRAPAFPETAISQSVRPMPRQSDKVPISHGLELLRVASLQAQKSQASTPPVDTTAALREAAKDGSKTATPTKKKRIPKPHAATKKSPSNTCTQQVRVYIDRIRESDILCGRGKHVWFDPIWPMITLGA